MFRALDMLDDVFSRRSFETAADLQVLCAQLAEVLTDRLRAARNLHMEVEWIVADLRARGHDVSRWDEVIANWEHPDDPYLWVCLEGVDLDEPSTNPDAKVSVSFRPRIPTKVAFRCPLCWSELVEREIHLNIQGHGSATAPGARVHFECPGLHGIDDTIGAASVERRRGVRVCVSCGAGLLLPGGG